MKNNTSNSNIPSGDLWHLLDASDAISWLEIFCVDFVHGANNIYPVSHISENKQAGYHLVSVYWL